ncbi:hypothetical protein O3M35_006796 [Rhynocoris fuscipes]|uniref:Uncharacterized protein n=1 Tax=Rhynocoris fuscipes TaxID=488301 RepID=A0AAW1DF07_9HEMI
MGSIVRNNVSVGDVKCRTSLVSSEPSGQEQLERKKRTRRRKAKRKNPYSKQISENRGKKNMRLRGNKSLYEQPVAPYNSNQFLIEDHNDLQDFDVKLMAAKVNKPGRVRDSSFTSADSDDDFFYSSPEDEEEFLTKEFSNAYQDLHVESLTSMSKAELIQQVLHLEEKVDLLQKRLGDKMDDEGEGDKSRSDISDKAKYFQAEISKLIMANEELKFENAKLREQNSRCLSESSEDSESDSSTSSDSSQVSMEHEITDQAYKHMNGDVHADNEINMDPTDNT